MTSDNIATYNDEAKENLTNALNLFYNAKDVKFKRVNNEILIEYSINDKQFSYIYDPKKGVLKDAR